MADRVAENARDDWRLMILLITLLLATHHPYLGAAVLAAYLAWTSLW